MVWPGVSDYQEAVQVPKSCFKDGELSAGSPVLTKLGLPRPISGGNASVYQIRSGRSEYAVRCFLRDVPDLRQRYAAIDQHLRGVKLRSKVGFEFLTEGIRVRVKPSWWADRSNPEAGQWAFTYTVTIVNEGQRPATLRRRHWVITDATGHVEEVRGLAVVGHQPLLKPGETFEYSSWTRIATPHGSMRGTYFCMTEDARPFETPVPEFQLVFPGLLH